MSRNSTVRTTKQFAANAETLVLDVREYNTAMFSLFGTGNYTIAFEGSDDGTNWYPISVARMNSNTVETTYANVNGVQLWETSCHLLSYVRLRVTAFTSNAGSTVAINASPIAVEPAPTTQATTAVQSVTVTTLPSGTAFALLAAATTNATIQKASAGNLFELDIVNFSATPKFIKLYDKATAPTVGTDIPVVTIEVAANSSKLIEFGNIGKRFTTGIAYAMTTAQPTSDTTALSAGDVRLTGSYI